MASNYYYPTSKNGIQKTLAAQLLNTASTGDAITFSDVDGVENKPGVLVINRVDANGADTPSAREFISYSGTSGNTVLIETRNVDGSGATRTHVVNSIVEFVADGVWGQRVIDQALVAHEVTGVHKSGLALPSPVITTPQINDTSADHQYILGVSELTADRTITLPLLTGNDDFVFEDHTQTLTNKTLTNPTLTAPVWDGWNYASETWTYASADDPTYTFTIAGVDLTTKYYAGMKIKLTQTTVKYFIITKVAFSTDTTITVYGGTDYDLANAAITLPYYSTAKAPAGFSLSPVKWSVEVVNTANASQSSPTTGTWYNLGSITISVPIGVWNTKYQAHLRSEKGTITYIDIAGTLSTANNSESDKEWTGYIGANGASGTISAKGAIYRSGVLTLTSKTSYYLNGAVVAISGGTADSVQFRGDLAETVITATSAYL